LSLQETQLSRMKSRKAALESREFETPGEKEKALESLEKNLEMMEGRVSNLRSNLEERLYPFLKSLKGLKSLGINTLTDKEGSEQTFYLAVEEE